jgi:molybdopterin-guanine dinucleotide biosynthesis protein A
VPVDDSGFRQPLCSVVRADALRGALDVLGDPAGRSLRDLLSLLNVKERALGEAEMGWVDDIDTPDDLARARSSQALILETSTASQRMIEPPLSKEQDP